MDSVGSWDVRSAEMLPALLLEPSLNIYTRQSRDKAQRLCDGEGRPPPHGKANMYREAIRHQCVTVRFYPDSYTLTLSQRD